MNSIAILILGFIALLWGANHLVTGISGLTMRYKFSPLVAGLTIAALGTSIPEISIAIISVIKDKNDLTIGNAIGSNIANIGLVLGLSILFKPSIMNYSTLKKAYPILIIIMLFSYGLMLDGFLGKVDGCLFLIVCIAGITAFIYLTNNTHRQDSFFKEFKSASFSTTSFKTNILNIIIGLVILPISAKYIVESATTIALWSGMSELTIGLTIIALGTTLPELSTAIIAVLKGEEDMAVGTILGSNIYNLLLILAFPAIINPEKINTIILRRDLPVLMALTLLLFFLNSHYKKQLSPWHGGILILIYCSYIISLILKASSH